MQKIGRAARESLNRRPNPVVSFFENRGSVQKLAIAHRFRTHSVPFAERRFIRMNYIVENHKIPIKGEYDIIVAGAGVAGLAAALAARRGGKRVLLLEKSIMLGGLATLGHINYFVPMCNGRGRQIAKGMVDEFIRIATRYGYDVTPQSWKNGEPGPGPKGSVPERYGVRYSACMFALALTEMVRNTGIDVSFDTIASEPLMDGKHCRGVIVENKSGRQFYVAGVVIDCTGDADILFRAGVPTVQGGNYFSYLAYGIDLAHCNLAVENRRIDQAVFYMSGGSSNLYGKGHPDGMPLFSGTTGEDVNRYLLENQLELLRKLKGDDRAVRQVISLPGMCQYRTTRRIMGDYTLRVEDRYKHFADSIAAVSDFEQRDYLYEIPYRTLVHKGYDNLITAGRSASGEGYAWDIMRVIPPAILTGQAAGCAAVQSLDMGVGIDAIDVERLQTVLKDQNVILHFDDAWRMDSSNQSGGESV